MQEVYLQELKLSKGCSLEQILKAYRKRVMEVHPDRGGTSEQFILVKTAYEWLIEHYNEDEIVESEHVVDTWKNWKSTLDSPEVEKYSNIERDLYEAGLGTGFNPHASSKGSGSYRSKVNETKWDGKFISNSSAHYYLDLYYFLSNDTFQIKFPGFKSKEFNLTNDMPGIKRTVSLDRENSVYSVDFEITFINKPSKFKIDGHDIVYSHEIDFNQLYNRKPFVIPHPSKRFPLSGGEEQLTINIPDEMYSCGKIIVPKLGFYDLKRKRQGDLHVELVYLIPKA